MAHHWAHDFFGWYEIWLNWSSVTLIHLLFETRYILLLARIDTCDYHHYLWLASLSLSTIIYIFSYFLWPNSFRHFLFLISQTCTSRFMFIFSSTLCILLIFILAHLIIPRRQSYCTCKLTICIIIGSNGQNWLPIVSLALLFLFGSW